MCRLQSVAAWRRIGAAPCCRLPLPYSRPPASRDLQPHHAEYALVTIFGTAAAHVGAYGHRSLGDLLRSNGATPAVQVRGARALTRVVQRLCMRWALHRRLSSSASSTPHPPPYAPLASLLPPSRLACSGFAPPASSSRRASRPTLTAACRPPCASTTRGGEVRGAGGLGSLAEQGARELWAGLEGWVA